MAKIDLIKLLKEGGQDMAADGMEMNDSVAYELAGGLLEDPEIVKEAQRMWPGKSLQTLQEIMADYI